MIDEESGETTSPIEALPRQPLEADEESLHQLITTIAGWLEETEEMPIQQIRHVVRKAGTEQTMALLKEVLAIEEQGGMLVGDKSRRRSIGGVFFYLARGKGYLPVAKRPAKPWKKKTTKTEGSASSDGDHATQPAWTWENRVADIADLQQDLQQTQETQGATNVKITLIGRPGRVSNRGTFLLTTIQSSKIPALPKGLPVPPQTSTTYTVYIAQKQWKKVEEALRNPEDILIAEGYPMLDHETGTIAVFVSNATTKFVQAAQREKQQAESHG